MEDIKMQRAYERLLRSTVDFPWVTAGRYSLEELVRGAQVLQLKKGDVLYDSGYDGRDIFVVRDGRIMNYFITSHGREKVVGVFTEGSLLGELRALDESTDFYTSQVSSEYASLYVVPCEKFLGLLDRSREVRMAVYENLAAKVRLMSRQIEYSVCTSAVTKIAYILLSACKYYGQPAEGGYRISLRFTHSEIARLCGISRVSASNRLQELRASGVIDQQDGLFVLRDIGALLDMLE